MIQKQILEVHVAREQDAWPLQQQLARIGRSLSTVIERCCNEASPSGRLHRIARLEVDLGRFERAELAEEFGRRIGKALTAALARACADAETGSSRHQAALELVVRFLEQGHLPWWADPAHEKVLEENLELLLRESAAELADVLRPLLGKSEARARAIRHFPPPLLSVMVARVAGLRIEALPLVDSLTQQAMRSGSEKASPPDRLARTLWDSLLQIAAESRVATAQGFVDRVLRRWTGRLQLDAAELHELHRVAYAATGIMAGTSTDPRSSERNTVPLQQRPTSSSGEIGPLPDQSARELDSPQTHLDGGRIQTASEPPGYESSDPNSLEPAGPSSRRPHRFERASGDDVTLADPVAGEPDSRNVIAEIVDPDGEFYISNAGLAVLWPFLPAFFQDLGLTESGRFPDVADALRGTTLLQYLATGHPSVPAEYLLPLNKVLCGLEPEQLHDPESELSEAQCRAGEGFLREVIDRAPILNQMSTPGFRSTFLLRQGLLDWSDGSWRLRVERASYDVVLDRFPWSLGWIRLPWMSAPLRVEW
ncbi:MAG: hypothetical protein FIA97_05425 [Methylococcaceae bacterium]|nr:hypothetical protein [Methylococcaceae bacterium]